jgi:protein O-GlcNAc transferase
LSFQTQDIPQLMQTANARFEKGEIAAAEGIARDVLDVAPGHSDALDLIARITAALGLDENSRRSPERKYLVIESWGHGFWSDVTNVLGYLLLAEITGRIPITHWGPNCLFTDGYTEDCFTYFFEPVSSCTLNHLRILKDASWFSAASAAETLKITTERGTGAKRIPGLLYLNRPETIAVSDFYTGVVSMLPWIPKTHVLAGKRIDEVYRWLAAKYLRPVKSIVNEVDAFWTRHIKDRPTVAVHFRGLDKGEELPLKPTLQWYFETLDRVPSSVQIFLLSDDARAVSAFAGRYGERVLVTESTRAEGHVGLHKRVARDPVRLGREVIVDVYVALRCDRFLGVGWSNISSIIDMLKPWPRGTCGLWGPCILRARLF